MLCNNLAVRCLLEANELNEALNVINTIDIKNILELTQDDPSGKFFDNTPKHVSSIVFKSCHYATNLKCCFSKYNLLCYL